MIEARWTSGAWVLPRNMGTRKPHGGTRRQRKTAKTREMQQRRAADQTMSALLRGWQQWMRRCP